MPLLTDGKITSFYGKFSTRFGGVNLQTSNYTAVALDYGKLISVNSTSAVTVLLPASPPSPVWAVGIENAGTGLLTVSPNGLDLDYVTSSLTVTQNQGMWVFTDGTNYFTLRGESGGGGGTWVFEIPSGVLDGSNVTFTLSFAPNPVRSLGLLINELPQFQTNAMFTYYDYTISGNTITFRIAPQGDDLIFAAYQH